MVEKIKVTMEMLEKDPPEVILEANMPYSMIEDIGVFIATESTIVDETGCVYSSWRRSVITCFAYLLYASNLDVSGLDNWEGRKALFDVYNDKVSDFMSMDYRKPRFVDDVVYDVETAIKTVYERRNSLDYKLGLLVDALREQTTSDTKEMGERLINLMDKVKEADAKATVADLTLFAKKDTNP